MADGGGLDTTSHIEDLQVVHEIIHHEGFIHHIPGELQKKIHTCTHQILFEWSNLSNIELWHIFTLLDEYVRFSVQNSTTPSPQKESGKYIQMLKLKLKKEDIAISIQRKVLRIILDEPLGYQRKYF